VADKRRLRYSACGTDRGTLGGIGRLRLPGVPAGGATVRMRIRIRAIAPVFVVVLAGVVDIGRRWF
jgi:hypothetical protein